MNCLHILKENASFKEPGEKKKTLCTSCVNHHKTDETSPVAWFYIRGDP